MKTAALPATALLLALHLAAAAAVEPAPPAATAPAASTYQAIQYDQYGAADVLHLVALPRKAPGPGQVRVRVHAAGVNPIDWKVRSGRFDVGRPLPAIPGYDIAGVVDAVGSGVTDVQAGDRIVALLDKSAGYAETALVERGELAKLPDAVSFIDAAALPTAGYTAWRSLVTYGGLERGQTVLVHAAPGGVGHYAVQIAHALGAKVIGTGSEANRAFVLGLGADAYVDYKTQRFEDQAKDVDLVLDAVGGDTLTRSYGVLREGGTLVSIVSGLDRKAMAARKLRNGDAQPRGRGDATVGRTLERLVALMAEGKLRSEIQATFPLARAADAQRQSETGHARGKLVLVTAAD